VYNFEGNLEEQCEEALQNVGCTSTESGYLCQHFLVNPFRAEVSWHPDSPIAELPTLEVGKPQDVPEFLEGSDPHPCDTEPLIACGDDSTGGTTSGGQVDTTNGETGQGAASIWGPPLTDIQCGKTSCTMTPEMLAGILANASQFATDEVSLHQVQVGQGYGMQLVFPVRIVSRYLPLPAMTESELLMRELGFRDGDVLLSFDGIAMQFPEDMITAFMALSPSATQHTVVFQRSGKTKTKTLTIQ
jgi:hypothetical protein